MLYNWNLLKRLINISDDLENIQKNLTLKSCEVEEAIVRKIPNDIVIWKTTKVEKHPDADKLFVCQVDCWDKGQYQIITWWENIVVDKFVPVALPDCYLPEIDLKIVPRKMRWLDSVWMICSKEELWIKLDLDKHWIWLLDEDFDDLTEADLWLPIWSRYEFLNNFILDVDNKTLTNRPDLTGHFWLAVELSAIYKNIESYIIDASDDELLNEKSCCWWWSCSWWWCSSSQKSCCSSKKSCSSDNVSNSSCNKKNSWFWIKFNRVSDVLNSWENTNIIDTLDMSDKSWRSLIVNSDNVRSYIALEIKNVNIKSSDLMLSSMIIDLWQSPRNNWVDFSNLFMNFSWNPVHFFDADKIKWAIIIRQANDWEKFVDLFDKEHSLTVNDLVIADDEKILALAWIVGSKSSQVDENTKNITVEIANFDPVCVRKTWTRLWLRTDAELRFEKNISPAFTLYSLLLFLDELKYFSKSLWSYELAWLEYFANEYTKTLFNKNIQLTSLEIENFIFWRPVDWFSEISSDILNNLWFNFRNNVAKVPIRRSPSDINIPEDLYEEVVRIYWYENIPEEKLLWEMSDAWYNDVVSITRKIEDSLVWLKYISVETYPWVDIDILRHFNVNLDELVKLQNPVASEYEHLRDWMVYNLLNVVERNFRSSDKINIFDIWKVWKLVDNKPLENLSLNFMFYQRNKKSWEDDAMLYNKWSLVNLLKDLWIKGKIDFDITNDERSHPRKQAKIKLNWVSVWWIASLHPIYYDFFKFPETSEISYVELNLDLLLEISWKQWKKFSWVKYETLVDNVVWKDISFVVDVNSSFWLISDAILKTKNVLDVRLFDIYSGSNIPEWKKSISLSVKIDGNWLSSDEINDQLWKIIWNVEKVWATIRWE